MMEMGTFAITSTKQTHHSLRLSPRTSSSHSQSQLEECIHRSNEWIERLNSRNEILNSLDLNFSLMWRSCGVEILNINAGRRLTMRIIPRKFISKSFKRNSTELKYLIGQQWRSDFCPVCHAFTNMFCHSTNVQCVILRKCIHPISCLLLSVAGKFKSRNEPRWRPSLFVGYQSAMSRCSFAQRFRSKLWSTNTDGYFE